MRWKVKVRKNGFQNKFRIMYKLGTTPLSKQPTKTELADFLEVKCLLSPENVYSINSAKSAIVMSSDEELIAGAESEEDIILIKLEEALFEIKDRKLKCGTKYPFFVEHSTVKLHHESDVIKQIYIYLLLATRANMNTERIQSDEDGTLLFEELSEIIAKKYFGENSRTLIFGTSMSEIGSFKAKIEALLEGLNESGEFRNPEGSLGKQKDGKLDIVVWKPFADKRPAKLIGFGQCKTGTSWQNTITQLQPSAFMSCYTTCNLYTDPVRLFFIADSCVEGWEECARNAGILFDRCRLMDFLPNTVESTLFERINRWTSDIITKYS